MPSVIGPLLMVWRLMRNVPELAFDPGRGVAP